jgi:hypothetical protein
MIMMMQGKKYSFQVVSRRESYHYWFSLRASSKTSGRTSCINNLNTILSQFGVEMEDSRVSDSEWIVSKREVRCFVDTATQFLSDAAFLDYLEKQLDEDRMLGEWENVF